MNPTQVIADVTTITQLLPSLTVHLGRTFLKAQAKLAAKGIHFALCQHSLAAFQGGAFDGIDYIGRDTNGTVHYIGINLQNNKHRGKITYGRNTPFHVKSGTTAC